MLENQSNAWKSIKCSKIIQMLENHSKPRKSLKYSKITQILENHWNTRKSFKYSKIIKLYGGNVPNRTVAIYQTVRRQCTKLHGCNWRRWACWNPDKIPWKKSKAQNSPQVTARSRATLFQLFPMRRIFYIYWTELTWRTYKHKTGAGLPKYCCRGKAIIVEHYTCVSVSFP